MSVYKGSMVLYHIDLYRINDEEELEYLGITDIVYENGITVIEWGERAATLLPENTVYINLDIIENGIRKIEIKKQ